MTTAQIAIIISVISATIAGLSLGWNIYRDVILKAKVIIGISIVDIVEQGNPDVQLSINIAATNHGPGPVKLSMIQVKNSSWWRWLFRQEEYGIVLQDQTNPVSGKLPHKLEVGDSIDILLPYDNDCFLSHGWSHVGLNDYFGRVHWAPSKKVKVSVKQWKKDFN